MASFNLEWRSSTRKDLRNLPPQEVGRILTAADSLAIEPFPHGSEKLSGTDHLYRIRLGDYRIVYEVLAQSRTVIIQRVRHRKDVYR